jgi:hypothetical protein
MLRKQRPQGCLTSPTQSHPQGQIFDSSWISMDIPAGTAFQYRNLSDKELKFICIAMPLWPGDSEASYLDGI